MHNTLAIEQTLMNMIRRGDTDGLKSWIADAPAVHAGAMAQEHIRQYKNTFIVTATLAARSAIRGGVSAEEALSTSDLLIRNCEALQDVQSILGLQVRMLMDYTERVSQLKKGIHATKLSLEVASYVLNHLSELISTDEMARKLHYSRTHLSRKFHEDMSVRQFHEALSVVVGHSAACSHGHGPWRIGDQYPAQEFGAFDSIISFGSFRQLFRCSFLLVRHRSHSFKKDSSDKTAAQVYERRLDGDRVSNRFGRDRQFV